MAKSLFFRRKSMWKGQKRGRKEQAGDLDTIADDNNVANITNNAIEP